MKKFLTFVIVTWTLQFSGNSVFWSTQKMNRSFDSRKATREFIKFQPKEGKIFECVDSLSGQQGYCKVSDVKIKEK